MSTFYGHRAHSAFGLFMAALLMWAAPAARAQQPQGLPISAQQFTVRNAGTLDQQLAVIEQAGIKYVEPYRFFGMKEIPIEEFKAALDRHHLKVSGMHINFGDIADNLKHTVEYNKALGNTRLIVPAFNATMVPHSKAAWQSLGGVMQTIAVTLKADGMKLGFHNHTVEMEVFDGKTGLEWFAEAAPDVIITVDCAWAAQGGQDPAELLRRLKGHVWNIHVKDNAPAGTAKDQRGLATVGKGVLNWDRILAAAHDAGVQWYTLEHDFPKPDELTVLKEGKEHITPKLHKILGM